MRDLHRCRNNYEVIGLFAAQKMAVAILRHPFCTRQMAIVGAARAFRLLLRIDLQNDPRDLAPVDALGVSIESVGARSEIAELRCGSRIGGYAFRHSGLLAVRYEQ